MVKSALALPSSDLTFDYRLVAKAMLKRTRETSSEQRDSDTSDQDDGLEDQSEKYLHVDQESPQVESIVCHHAPHGPLSFHSYAEYEKHYQRNHINRCSECQKNFPSDHFLNLHITEQHDTITAIKRERGDKTFACFVEGCDKVCSTWQRRRSHLVDKHMYPREFDFFIVKDGIDGRSSMLRSGKRNKGRPTPEAAVDGTSAGASTFRPEVPAAVQGLKDKDEVADVEMLSSSLQSLQFVPSKVRFGRQKSSFKKDKG